MNWVRLYLKLLSLLLGLLVIVCLIPSTRMKANVENSVDILIHEGLYPQNGPAFRPIVLDNFTDSLMLNTAYSVESTKPFRSALQSIYSVPTVTVNKNNQILNLEKLTNGDQTEKITYDRYWHGYLVYLRPLLIVFDYSHIRSILSVSIVSLLTILFILAWKKTSLTKALCLLFGFLSVDILSTGKSMQFAGVFIVAISSAIYWVRHEEMESEKLFFIIGGLTAFVDLLTAPLITLELLLIIGILHFGYKNCKQLLILSWLWFSGYLSIWISKWVLSQIFFTKGSILTAIDQIRDRTIGIPDEQFSRLATVKINLFQLIGYGQVSKMLFLSVFLLAFAIVLKNRKRISFKRVCGWLVPTTMPYVWYLIVANHSYLHVWYTYRAQFGAVVAGLLLVESLLKNTPDRSKKIM